MVTTVAGKKQIRFSARMGNPSENQELAYPEIFFAIRRSKPCAVRDTWSARIRSTARVR
jgi:hypothetical protein